MFPNCDETSGDGGVYSGKDPVLNLFRRTKRAPRKGTAGKASEAEGRRLTSILDGPTPLERKRPVRVDYLAPDGKPGSRPRR